MGIDVYYSLGDADGIKTSFLADLATFSAWLDPRIAADPTEFPPGMQEKIQDFLRRGDAAFDTASEEEAALIDAIVIEYFWEFCNQGNRHPAIQIMTLGHRLDNYPNALSDVLPAASADANRYYRSLFEGRSLARCDGHVFTPPDEVFELSWLLPPEVGALLGELEGFKSEYAARDGQQEGVARLVTVLREARLKETSLVVAIA